ncbi:MAG: aspartate-semialdehyde dehydrogenase [candidate division WOR-3 bacterium]
MQSIAIAGATGLVGETLLQVLESSRHPIKDIRLFASAKSAGTQLTFRDQEYTVQEVSVEGFKGCEVAFFCLEADLARRLIPDVAKLCPVIDKSSHYRLKENVPLVVPEVNAEALKNHRNIIASPDCTTIPLVVAVNPLHVRFGLERLWIATYQSASGAGRQALEQLFYETEFIALRQHPDTTDSPLKYQLADNLIPQIGELDTHGFSEEENKTIRETRKILNLPELKIISTCVRVPLTIGHSLAVTCRFRQPVKPKDAEKILKDAPGVSLRIGPQLATPADARGNDNVYVCRVRQGAEPEEISLFVITDNLRKGAATNAIQIAELLTKQN